MLLTIGFVFVTILTGTQVLHAQTQPQQDPRISVQADMLLDAAQPRLSELTTAQATTSAHVILGQILGNSSSVSIVDGPAPGDPSYPFVTVGGWLSQATAPDVGVSVELFATARDVADRKLALQRSAPEDRLFSGSYSAGSVLVRISSWVSDAQASTYGQNLAQALIVLQ